MSFVINPIHFYHTKFLSSQLSLILVCIYINPHEKKLLWNSKRKALNIYKKHLDHPSVIIGPRVPYLTKQSFKKVCFFIHQFLYINLGEKKNMGPNLEKIQKIYCFGVFLVSLLRSLSRLDSERQK